MRLLELLHENRAIDELMLAEFRRSGTEKAAAKALGITQQTFNIWKFRLGLDEEIEAIRQERRGKLPPNNR
jgi:hypothetical protein